MLPTLGSQFPDLLELEQVMTYHLRAKGRAAITAESVLGALRDNHFQLEALLDPRDLNLFLEAALVHFYRSPALVEDEDAALVATDAASAHLNWSLTDDDDDDDDEVEVLVMDIVSPEEKGSTAHAQEKRTSRSWDNSEPRKKAGKATPPSGKVTPESSSSEGGPDNPHATVVDGDNMNNQKAPTEHEVALTRMSDKELEEKRREILNELDQEGEPDATGEEEDNNQDQEDDVSLITPFSSGPISERIEFSPQKNSCRSETPTRKVPVRKKAIRRVVPYSPPPSGSERVGTRRTPPPDKRGRSSRSSSGAKKSSTSSKRSKKSKKAASEKSKARDDVAKISTKKQNPDGSSADRKTTGEEKEGTAREDSQQLEPLPAAPDSSADEPDEPLVVPEAEAAPEVDDKTDDDEAKTEAAVDERGLRSRQDTPEIPEGDLPPQENSGGGDAVYQETDGEKEDETEEPTSEDLDQNQTDTKGVASTMVELPEIPFDPDDEEEVEMVASGLVLTVCGHAAWVRTSKRKEPYQILLKSLHPKGVSVEPNDFLLVLLPMEEDDVVCEMGVVIDRWCDFRFCHRAVVSPPLIKGKVMVTFEKDCATNHATVPADKVVSFDLNHFQDGSRATATLNTHGEEVLVHLAERKRQDKLGFRYRVVLCLKISTLSRYSLVDGKASSRGDLDEVTKFFEAVDIEQHDDLGQTGAVVLLLSSAWPNHLEACHKALQCRSFFMENTEVGREEGANVASRYQVLEAAADGMQLVLDKLSSRALVCSLDEGVDREAVEEMMKNNGLCKPMPTKEVANSEESGGQSNVNMDMTKKEEEENAPGTKRKAEESPQQQPQEKKEKKEVEQASSTIETDSFSHQAPPSRHPASRPTTRTNSSEAKKDRIPVRAPEDEIRVRRVDAIKPELCIKYFFGDCQKGDSCHRAHELYEEMMGALDHCAEFVSGNMCSSPRCQKRHLTPTQLSLEYQSWVKKWTALPGDADPPEAAVDGDDGGDSSVTCTHLKPPLGKKKSLCIRHFKGLGCKHGRRCWHQHQLPTHLGGHCKKFLSAKSCPDFRRCARDHLTAEQLNRKYRAERRRLANKCTKCNRGKEEEIEDEAWEEEEEEEKMEDEPWKEEEEMKNETWEEEEVGGERNSPSASISVFWASSPSTAGTTATAAARRGKIKTPCKFFAQGKCRKGTRCNFMHDLRCKVPDGGDCNFLHASSGSGQNNIHNIPPLLPLVSECTIAAY